MFKNDFRNIFSTYFKERKVLCNCKFCGAEIDECDYNPTTKTYFCYNCKENYKKEQ